MDHRTRGSHAPQGYRTRGSHTPQDHMDHRTTALCLVTRDEGVRFSYSEFSFSVLAVLYFLSVIFQYLSNNEFPMMK